VASCSWINASVVQILVSLEFVESFKHDFSVFCTDSGETFQEVIVQVTCLQEEGKAVLFNLEAIVDAGLLLCPVVRLYQLQECIDVAGVVLCSGVHKRLIISLLHVFLDSHHVKGINQQIRLDVVIQWGVCAETRRKVDFENEGFEVTIQDDVEAK
jgi:hypothetical protein